MPYRWNVVLKDRSEVDALKSFVKEKKKRAGSTERVTLGSEMLKAINQYIDIENNDLILINRADWKRYVELEKLVQAHGLEDELKDTHTHKTDKPVGGEQKADSIMYA